MDTYWSLGIFVFLMILSLYKYTSKDQLSEWIWNYIEEILPREVEEDEVVQLEDLHDIIYDFIIRNQNIFSKIKVNNEPGRSGETSEGDSKES
jgi:hypothetical protein